MQIFSLKYLIFIPFMVLFFNKSFHTSNTEFDAVSGPTYKEYNPQQQIILLELDYNTLNVIGHKLYTFQKNYSDTFKLLPIIYHNQINDDYAYFSFIYANQRDTICSGNLTWKESGIINIPKKFDSISYKKSSYFSLFKPKVTQYYNLPENKTDQKKYLASADKIFSKISSLEILSSLSSNNFKMGYFLFSPQVGITDYSKARWLIFLIHDIN